MMYSPEFQTKNRNSYVLTGPWIPKFWPDPYIWPISNKWWKKFILKREKRIFEKRFSRRILFLSSEKGFLKRIFFTFSKKKDFLKRFFFWENEERFSKFRLVERFLADPWPKLTLFSLFAFFDPSNCLLLFYFAHFWHSSVPDLKQICVERCENQLLECILGCHDELECITTCIRLETECTDRKLSQLSWLFPMRQWQLLTHT